MRSYVTVWFQCSHESKLHVAGWIVREFPFTSDIPRLQVAQKPYSGDIRSIRKVEGEGDRMEIAAV